MILNSLIIVGLVFGLLKFFGAIAHEIHMLAFEWWRARNRFNVGAAGASWESLAYSSQCPRGLAVRVWNAWPRSYGL